MSRSMKRAFAAALAGLALAMAGCSAFQIETHPGDVLFQDDFTRAWSGWDRHHEAAYSADYVSGTYHILVNAANADAVANPGLDFGDVKVQVEATRVGGPENNVFGLICRSQDPRDYYFFVVSSDGYAGIGISKAGRRHLLSSDTLLPARPILGGSQTNVLRADCIGYHLDLYVNGTLVSQAQSAEWPTGDVGLLAGSYSEGGVEIAFDNFSVTQP